MSAPTSPPPPAAPYAAPPRAMRTIPISWLTVAVTVGTAIAAAGIFMSAVTSRSHRIAVASFATMPTTHSELHWAKFALGLLASLALIAVGVAGHLLDRDPDRRRLLVSYPGAVGALGLGAMAVDVSDKAGTWLAGPVALVVAGLLWLLLDRSTPLLLVAMAGLLAFVARVIVKLVDANHPSEHTHAAVWVVLGTWAVVGALSAAAWFVPESRDTLIVVAGIVGAVVSLGALFVLEAQRIAGLYSAFDSSGSSSHHGPGFTVDVWVVLLVTLVGVAGWAYCYLRSPRAAYRVIILVVLIILLPATVTILSVVHPHPSTWMTVFAVVGILVLAGALVLGLANPTGGAHGAPPVPPSGPSYPAQETRVPGQPQYPGDPRAPSGPRSAPPSGPSGPPPSYRPPYHPPSYQPPSPPLES